MILADTCGNKLVTPEHLLLSALGDKVVNNILESSVLELPLDEVKEKLRDYIDRQEHFGDDEVDRQMYASHQYGQLMQIMQHDAELAATDVVDVPHLFLAMLQLKESFAANCLNALVNEDKDRFLKRLIYVYTETQRVMSDHNDDAGSEIGDDGELLTPDERENPRAATGGWRDYVLCINDHLADHNPLIGREAELDRTVQVLCRKDKNNPLHIGEPGVGKTSIVYGLAQRIQDGNVPETLRDARIYQLDMGSLIAGTQYRGDFEKRLKTVMKGIAAEKGSILYIDEIHNIWTRAICSSPISREARCASSGRRPTRNTTVTSCATRV